MGWPERFTPSRRWLFLPPILVGVLAVISLAMSKKELTRVPPPQSAQPMRVVRAITTEIAPQATGYGTARPVRQWTAVAEVGGRVVETHPRLRSGIYVESGQRLLRIDDADYLLREKQRQADLAQARAQAEQLKLSQESDRRSLAIQEKLLAVRQSDVDRLAKLRDTSAASESEADAAQGIWLTQMQAVQTLKNSLSLYPAQIAAAEANIEIAEARLAEAVRDVRRTEITAPFAGVLAGVKLELDQYVAPAQRLFELHDVDSIEIESQFSLSQLSRLIPAVAQSDAALVPLSRRVHSIHSAALRASVTTRSGDLAIHYDGNPVRVREAIDDQTRTLGIVVRVANRPDWPESAEQEIGDPRAEIHTGPMAQPPKMPLRPGTYCEVTLRSKLPVNGILIPRTAVDNDTVFVVDQQNRARRRRVQVGFAVGDQLAITAGLAAEELVVVKPLAWLTDGKRVRPEPAVAIDDDLVSSREVSETR